MANIETHLAHWLSAGVVDAETAARIRAFEARAATAESLPETEHSATRWQSLTALILGVILLACGVALFVSAHWNELAPLARLALVFAMVAVFHLAGGFAQNRYHSASTALHAVGTLTAGPAVALIGQIYNLESHWPAAVLLWAIAALAGWLFLRDQAQQTLALLLIPAWLTCEIAYRADLHIGADVYIGRMLLTWAILYLTFFAGSNQKVVQGILFAVAAIAAVVSTPLMLSAYESYSSTQTYLPFGARFWAWTAIAALPLIIAAFHGHKGLIPIAVSILYAGVLPWCFHSYVQTFHFQQFTTHYTRTEPNLLAHILVASFAVFLCGWGVRIASRALVNFGIVAFAAAVGWFYFSSLMTALGRSLGLIGLGVLFLAGGWALEKLRRRMIARIALTQSLAEAQ